MLWIILFVLVFLRLQENDVQAASVLLKKAYNCPNAPNSIPITFDVTLLKTFPNNTQLLDVNLDLPFAMHTNTLASAKIEYNALGNTWVPVAKVDDKKGMCNFFTATGNEMWFEFQREAGMTPRRCPIPQGKHHTNHCFLDLTKQKISTIPPGNYRVTVEVREKSNNRILLCKMFDIEDKS